MRAAVKDQAELIAISYAERIGSDLRIGRGDGEGLPCNTFPAGCSARSGSGPPWGGCSPKTTTSKPGAHPYAVLSYDYWTRRFGQRSESDRAHVPHGQRPLRDRRRRPEALHRHRARHGDRHLRAHHDASPGASARTRPGSGRSRAEAGRCRRTPSRQAAAPPLRAFWQERAKGFAGMPKQSIDDFLNQTLLLEPAAAGVSGMQRDYRVSLAALGVLVALVLLIACANVANLMTAQAAARAREMALRVSIGAGRWRLVQLVLVESAWLAFLAAALGAVFAWWSAPFVVGMINPPDNPARLFLPADWRVLGFGLALTARRDVAVRPGAGAARLGRQAGERAQRRRRPALAAPPDACADRRAGGLLFSGAFRRRPVRRHVRPAVEPAHRLFRRTASRLSIRSRHALSRRSSGTRWPNICARCRASKRSRWPVGRCWTGTPGTTSFRSTARLPARCWPTS